VFKTTKAFSSFSVDDLGRARKFYGDTLGLEIEESPEGLELNIGDGSHVFVYPKGTMFRPPLRSSIFR
jgi:catechol 2,3-dioxygenase-like lactoylglutathione lyase family enzyme